ncbi:hypothetical protein [Desulfosporosinus sp. Sb-LF]|uniref:hypothetical protein n=1 Tax=Desulfosporosinus sp. Sb-LF TaxID=2560027 RepID=UPI00107F5A90|nr:hypothetical protein [Desulfosporosinus sp. Sb-LF]TGE34408.1 hypothetical protein E4K68_01595 [Desulfosporosinus sp. Sb-LF]
MKIRGFLKTYTIFFVIIASPFLLLSFSNLFIPINIELTVYGYVFSVLASFYLAWNLRKDRITVSFDNREHYIDKLNSRLQILGYTEQGREGFLTTFEPLNAYFPGHEVSAYIFKDTAVIITPRKHSSILQESKNMCL